jgi:hypothetical protein
MSWIKLGERLDEEVKRKERVKYRQMFGVGNHVPVVEADVDKPTLTGRIGGWRTKGGTPIQYPSAYSKKGWGNMMYFASTLQILIPRKTNARTN